MLNQFENWFAANALALQSKGFVVTIGPDLKTDNMSIPAEVALRILLWLRCGSPAKLTATPLTCQRNKRASTGMRSFTMWKN